MSDLFAVVLHTYIIAAFSMPVVYVLAVIVSKAFFQCKLAYQRSLFDDLLDERKG